MPDYRYFSSTNNFGKTLDFEDDVYTVEEFKQACKGLIFMDYDGFGYPIKNRRDDSTIVIKPSRLEDIPEDATHIIWFNR